MITIKITNAQQIVERERNWFVSKVAPLFIDIQSTIEKKIAKEIEKSLVERKIQAVVSVVEEDEVLT